MRLIAPALLTCALSLAAAAQTASQMPWYSEETVVSYASLRPGPVSPYSLVTIFGRNLAWSVQFRDQSSASDLLPLILPGSFVTVMVNGLAVPVELVSPEQVVFLMPPVMGEGQAEVRLVHAGRAGPAVKISIRQFAPALYLIQDGVALARHPDTYEWVTPENPAVPGQDVILYATGLGPVRPSVDYRRTPREPAEIAARGQFEVWLNEEPAPDDALGYVGIMPGFPGIYEIHLRLPERLPPNPQVRLRIAGEWSGEEIRLAVAGHEEIEREPEP
jgi:uncharacterized protein (TIGR03437 family)